MNNYLKIMICRKLALGIMDVFKDKSWVKLRRMDNEYMEYLNAFLDHAFSTSAVDDKILCPCTTCANRFHHEREVVRVHLLMKGMDANYRKHVWVYHGEPILSDNDGNDEMLDDQFNHESHGSIEHDMYDMIGDGFACHESINDSSGPNEETKRFFKLIEDAGQPLYPGCEEFSKLSFIVEMYHLKCMYNVSDRAFDAFTKLFKRALPKDSGLPNSFKQMQSIIKQFDLGYKKIDACSNDCVLFW